MRLELQLFEEKDVDAYLSICWAAFEDGIMSIMYPDGYTEAAREAGRKRMLKLLREKPEETKFVKMVDHDLPENDPNGKAVGMARWSFYPKDRTEEELAEEEKKDDEQEEPIPGINTAFMKEFHANISKYKKEIMGGKAYVLLGILAVLPQYQRCGVGSKLMDWGLPQADEMKLPAYLEASPMGKGLYIKKGFEEVCEFELDAKKWGFPRDLPHVCMVRPARA